EPGAWLARGGLPRDPADAEPDRHRAGARCRLSRPRRQGARPGQSGDAPGRAAAPVQPPACAAPGVPEPRAVRQPGGIPRAAAAPAGPLNAAVVPPVLLLHGTRSTTTASACARKDGAPRGAGDLLFCVFEPAIHQARMRNVDCALRTFDIWTSSKPSL